MCWATGSPRRATAIETAVDTHLTLCAPHGWHPVVANFSPSGQTLLRVRFAHLTTSRANNVAKVLLERGWSLDEDGDGSSHRMRAGTDATDIAFEMLAVATASGAPADERTLHGGP
ncbi:MAG: hypothetical protein R2698_03850 [Microthrixaceae bacterium]